MTTTDDSSLRIRLEGGLEVIEQSTALLGTLRELTATRWELRAAALRAQLERWRTERAGLDEALARARALPEATAALDRYEAASTALVARLSTGTFEGTDVHRAVGLQPKLSALEVLAAHTGERHDRAPLASAEREERLPLLVPGGLLTVLLALAGHWPWVAACAVLTGLAWQASARRTTWRVFADRLEVARASGPVLATPLTSAALQALPALGDTAELAPRQPITVASVRRLVVPDVEELEPVLAVLAQLRSEVDAFERQEAALRAQDPTMTLGTWVPRQPA